MRCHNGGNCFPRSNWQWVRTPDALLEAHGTIQHRTRVTRGSAVRAALSVSPAAIPIKTQPLQQLPPSTLESPTPLRQPSALRVRTFLSKTPVLEPYRELGSLTETQLAMGLDFGQVFLGNRVSLAPVLNFCSLMFKPSQKCHTALPSL